MRRDISVADSFPCVSIFSFGVLVSVIFFVVSVVFLLMFLAKPLLGKVGTAGIGAGMLRFPRHVVPPSGMKKALQDESLQGFLLRFLLTI